MRRIQPEEALSIIEQSVRRVDPVQTSILESLGCILDEAILAMNDQPPFPRSPLDGYAVRSEDIRYADREHPALLNVVGRSDAGAPSFNCINKNEAIRIMTGGAIPQEADCVVRQEDTDCGEENVLVYVKPAQSNVCKRGEDFQKGQALVSKGTKVNAAAAAVAAAAGQTSLLVIPRPKVSLLSTGEELQPAGKALAYGQIYDSNTPYLIGRLSELNVETQRCVTCGDRLDDTVNAIRSLLQTSDCIITTGGVSAGERDFVPEAVARAGGTILFHGIAMKPGMPTLFAVAKGKPILGLSGNPYSAAVAFERLGRAMLSYLSGDPDLIAKKDAGVLINGYAKSCSTVRYLRGIWKDGMVTLPIAQGNAQLHSLANCNCLVEISPDAGPMASGETVTVYLINRGV